MQLNCEMPGCAERLIGKVPICAKCRQRVPKTIYKHLTTLACEGKFGAEYREQMKLARNSILKAAAIVEKSITEVEQELEMNLDALYPPVIVLPHLKEPPPRVEWFIKDPEPAMFEREIEEKKKVDAEATTQALDWLTVYAVLISFVLVGLLIIMFGPSQR